MALTFNYKCNGCNQVKTNQELESFSCDCGGDFKMIDDHLLQAVAFDPHFNPTIGEEVTSWHDMEKKAKRAKSDKHPDGFHITDPKGKFAREMKHLRKHREEYTQEVYSKKGIKYVPGSNTHFSDIKGEFIRRGDDPHNPRPSGKVFSFRRG